jgi:hypothetical protein
VVIGFVKIVQVKDDVILPPYPILVRYIKHIEYPRYVGLGSPFPPVMTGSINHLIPPIGWISHRPQVRKKMEVPAFLHILGVNVFLIYFV